MLGKVLWLVEHGADVNANASRFAALSAADFHFPSGYGACAGCVNFFWITRESFAHSRLIDGDAIAEARIRGRRNCFADSLLHSEQT